MSTSVNLTDKQRYDLELYLKRIQYNGPLEESAMVLFQIHELQKLNIAFDGVDYYTGASANYDFTIDVMIQRILYNGRGGTCTTLNTLLVHMLTLIGFKQIKLFSAKWYSEKRNMWMERSHACFSVTVDNEEFLCDVGYGGLGCLVRPISFNLMGEIQQQYTNQFRLIQGINELYGCFIVQNKSLESSEWSNHILFTKEPLLLMDWEMIFWFSQNSKNSSLRRSLTVTLPTKEGMLSLKNTELWEYNGDLIIKRKSKSMNELLQVLEEFFKIKFADVQEPTLLKLFGNESQ
jgi:arylamine N-acetyltransferase